jgi:rod shape determining protein RodA
MEIKEEFKKLIFLGDFSLFFCALSLSIFGLVFLWSLSLSFQDQNFFLKQTIFLIVGIFLFFVFSLINFRAVKESSLFLFILYLLSLVLLLGLLFFAPNIRGQRSWFVFGFFTFQPVEIVKIFLILFFAKFFSQRHQDMYQAKHILISALYLFFPTFLVFLQPDFGSALSLVLLWLSILLVAGIKRKHLIFILISGILLSIIFWFFVLKEHQKARIITFLEPYLNPQRKYLDPYGTGYHIRQSLIALGSGGLFGKGIFNKKTLVKLGYLPEAETDFIFSGIGETFGILGSSILLGLFLFFFWRLYKILISLEDNFSRLFCVGFFLLVLSEMAINIGMTLGMVPIIGLPLPFVSYGGSNLIALYIGLGIVESFYVRRRFK